MSEVVTRGDVERARAVVQDRLHTTPILTSRALDLHVGASVLFKCEQLQKTGSFKVRGALNYLHNAEPSALANGVVTVSAGNHAQAVAWAGSASGVRSIVVMPEHAAAAKIDASRAYGAEVRLAPDAGLAFTEAVKISETEGPLFMHPFDHPWVVAGQGTVGLEIEEQVGELDAVVVPVGGGGLISGILTALAEQHPTLAIYGVEPVGAAAMSASLAAGHAVTLDTPPESIADGLAPPMAGVLNYAIVERFAKDVVRVTDDEIREAMQLIMSRAKTVIEPSAAAGFAALLCGKIPVSKGARVAVVLSGGNVSLKDLPSFLP